MPVDVWNTVHLVNSRHVQEPLQFLQWRLTLVSDLVHILPRSRIDSLPEGKWQKVIVPFLESFRKGTITPENKTQNFGLLVSDKNAFVKKIVGLHADRNACFYIFKSKEKRKAKVLTRREGLFSVLVEEDRHVIQGEVDEVARVVGDEAAEAAPDDAMPRTRHEASFHLFLDAGRDLPLYAELLHCLDQRRTLRL